jgi:hypothetical protein
MNLRLAAARSLQAALLSGSLVLGTSLLGSCGTVKKIDTADQQIRIDPLTPVAFDIENFHGNVRVVVDPTLTAVKPVIKKRVSWWVEQSIRKDAQDAITVRTRTYEDEGRSVVRIKTTTNWPEPERVWVNLTLYVPRCDGVRIWNRGGSVTLEGVAGAIQVENFDYAGNSAPIEVRTDRDIVDPVMLVTTSGTVAYQVGPGSTGQVTLDSADDREEFDCNVLHPGQIHSDGQTTTAILNSGANPVLLKSGSGRVIALVMDEPMGYTNKWR